ncbi:hypothetical protein R6V09_43235, partial [Streptomyces sp. W16]|nr:hypothetical protein [Streptomyces sp. W16]
GAVFQNRMQHSLDGTATGPGGDRRRLLRAAYASGLNGAFVLAGCLALLGALIALLLVRRTAPAAAPRETIPRGAAAGSR